MSDYDSGALSVLKGLDPVKKRPGMYTDEEKPNHLAQEVIDNSVDEALGGYATFINISIFKDGGLSVEDDGRGMPVDIHPEEKMSGVEVIMEKLHAGGKFEGKNYGFSGGLHGVGISVVNALSDKVTVEVKRDGKLHAIDYENGEKQSRLSVVKGHKFPKKETGTKVYFKPNPKYFHSSEFDLKQLKSLIKGKAILCAGLVINLYIEKTDEKITYHYEQGLSAFIKEQDDIDEAVGGVLFEGNSQKDEPMMDVTWACYWTENKNHLSNAYVNLIPTPQGGMHVNGFRQGLIDGLKEYATLHNLIPRNIKLMPDDLWKNTQFVLSLKMLEPSFDGQTKGRLTSRECTPFIASTVKDTFSLYLNANTEKAEMLTELAINNASARLKAAKKVTRKKIGKAMALPGKLTDCTTDTRNEAELFVVEGDSAGGSAKQARNKVTQAIMPLRGKILNTWEVDPSTLLASEEIKNISTAIGVDPNSDDLSELRYGKICILADADSDGLHIATLFMALFVKHFKAVINNGNVFVAMPPLYRIDVGKKVFYALDDAEKSSVLKTIERQKLKGVVNVQRFKGLGEMNPSQLRETTLDPATRRLVRVEIRDDEVANEKFDMLLAKKRANHRKQWLEENGNLADMDI